LQWQVTLQVEVLHVKLKGQGLQSDWQPALSAAQSKPGQQELGHTVVAPSQVTDPRVGQFWSTAEQLLVPVQLMVPPAPQFAEALQSALPSAGRFAAGAGAVAREATKA